MESVTQVPLCEASTPRCHGGKRPQGGSVYSEICLTAREAASQRALAGKVWSYQATSRRSSECPTEKKGFSVAATPDPESEVIPTAIPGSKEPTGGGMWTVTGAIHCSGRAQMVLGNSLPADTVRMEMFDHLQCKPYPKTFVI